MTDEMKVAFIMAQVVCAMAAIEAMKAANIERMGRGEALAYNELAFRNIENEYFIGHNTVIGYFTGRS